MYVAQSLTTLLKLLVIQCLQIIVQGLRESGIFSNVIAMSHKNLTEFISSVEHSKSSKAVSSGENSYISNATESGVISSRKIGQHGKSNTTARRVLQISDNTSFPSAVPPQSPPGPEDIQVEIF